MKDNGNLLVPAEVQELVKSKVAEEDQSLILEEIEKTVRLQSALPPMLDRRGKTEGDFNVLLPGFTGDTRPLNALSFEIVEEMLKSSPVRFTLEMKRAQIVSIFRNQRSWKIHSTDEELSKIVTANLRKIMPRMSMDFSFSALVYGTSFQELVWTRQTKSELGIEDSESSGKRYIVAKVPNSVNPKTIKEIRRTKSGSFNGFIQVSKRFGNEIIVPKESSLVIPYNGRFRNLWGESFFKAIYPIWFWYEVVLRAMVRYMERTGTPVVRVKAPSRAKIIKPGTSTKIDGMTWGMEIGSNLTRSNTAVIPSDVDPDSGLPLWDIDYLTTPNDRGGGFLQILEGLSQMIMRAGLSADRALSQSSGGVGSFNIGEIHKQATQIHNELILIEWMHYLNTHFLPLYSLYNNGPTGAPLWMETQGLDPTDRENLTTILGVAQGMKSFQDFSHRVDWESLLDVNEFPLLDEEQAEKIKEKAREESLKNQEDQLKMASRFESPNAPKDGQPKKPKPVPGTENQKELEEYTETIQLANPYHDAKGRFTFADKAFIVSGAVAASSFVAATAAKVKVNRAVDRELKRTTGRGLDSTSKKALRSARGKVLRRKAFSAKIGGREIGVSYQKVDRAGTVLARVGMAATLVAYTSWNYSNAMSGAQAGGPRRRRPSPERNRKKWPGKATDKDFRKMYRELSKRFHPDVGGDATTQQKINEFYQNKDWGGLEEMFKKLEQNLSMPTHQLEAFALFIVILKEGLADGVHYIVIPTDEKEAPPFIIENGEMIIPRDSAQLIVDAVENFQEDVRGLEEETSIQLANPFRDELGRFTTPDNAVIGQFGLPSQQEHARKHGRLSAATQSVVASTSEYVTRKKGLGPKLARLAIDVGPDIAIASTVSSGVFAKSSLLGGIATATLLGAVLGTVPQTAVIAGGVTVGLATTAIVSEVLDYAGTKMIHAYLNRNSPKDNNHIKLGRRPTRAGWKLAKVSYILGGGPIFSVFGEVLAATTGSAAELGPAIEALTELEEPQGFESDTPEFVSMLLPEVSGVAMGEIPAVRIPNIPKLRGFPGFRPDGEYLVLTADTVEEFANAWINETFPVIYNLSFGDASITLEEEGGSIQLFNPYHDALGRFTSKSGGSGGSSSSSSKKGKSSGTFSQVAVPSNRFKSTVSGIKEKWDNTSPTKKKVIVGAAVTAAALAATGVIGANQRKNLTTVKTTTNIGFLKDVPVTIRATNPKKAQEFLDKVISPSGEKVLGHFGNMDLKGGIEIRDDASILVQGISLSGSGLKDIPSGSILKNFPNDVKIGAGYLATKTGLFIPGGLGGMYDPSKERLTMVKSGSLSKKASEHFAVHEFIHSATKDLTSRAVASANFFGNATSLQRLEGLTDRTAELINKRTQLTGYQRFKSKADGAIDRGMRSGGFSSALEAALSLFNEDYIFDGKVSLELANEDYETLKFLTLIMILRGGWNGTIEALFLEFLEEELKKDKQLEDSEESIKLFNPYHDPATGRFTSAPSSGGSFGLFGGNEISSGQVSSLEGRVRSSTGKVHARMSGEFGVKETKVCDSLKCMSQSGANPRTLGSYEPSSGRIVISPKVQSLNSRDKDWVIAHEYIHSRVRTGNKQPNDFSRDAVAIEEGTTDLMAHMIASKKPNIHHPYYGHMAAQASWARSLSGNDRNRAWKEISRIHKNNVDGRSVREFKDFLSNNPRFSFDESDLDWMMASKPTVKLEASEREVSEVFGEQEEAIYKTMESRKADFDISELLFQSPEEVIKMFKESLNDQ